MVRWKTQDQMENMTPQATHVCLMTYWSLRNLCLDT
jgi:hypothetical protein